MSTIFDHKINLVYWYWRTINESSVGDLARRIKENMPNVSGVMVKALDGASWLSPKGADRLAIWGERALATWVEQLGLHGLDTHVWGVPKGFGDEASYWITAANVNGVKSILLDLEGGKGFWSGNANTARKLMSTIRQGAPNVHIGLIVDSRNSQREPGSRKFFWEAFLTEAESIHPMTYPWLFSRNPSKERVKNIISECYTNAGAFERPVYPMLQCFEEVSPPPSAKGIVQQAELASDLGATGVSYFRIGDDLGKVTGMPHMGIDAMRAIASLQFSQANADRLRHDPRAPQNPVSRISSRVKFTWQQLIDALNKVAKRYGVKWQDWFIAEYIGARDPGSGNYDTPFTGNPIAEWTHIPEEARQMLLLELNLTVDVPVRSPSGNIAEMVVRPAPVRQPHEGGTILNVPYITQKNSYIGRGYGSETFNNDCGPTCVTMILHAQGRSDVRIDKLYELKEGGKKILPQGDSFSSLGDLKRLLIAEKSPAKYYGNFSRADAPAPNRHNAIDKAREFIQKGLPFIIPVLQNETPYKAGNAKHFVLVVGIDDNDTVYINDPWLPPDYPLERVPYKRDEFLRAWNSNKQDGITWYCIVPDNPVSTLK